MSSQEIASFAPVSHKSAKVLILGSMPGIKSLAAGQYYAHPQNCFWRVMGRIIGIDHATPYPERLKAMTDAGVALWDVLRSCERIGSLDAAIKPESIIANDFRQFFDRHLAIKLVCFNGTLAEQSYLKHVRPKLEVNDLRYVRLPSTSPAHTLSVEKKIEAWLASGILDAIGLRKPSWRAGSIRGKLNSPGQ